MTELGCDRLGVWEYDSMTELGCDRLGVWEYDRVGV